MERRLIELIKFWELERLGTGLSIKLSGLAVRIVHGSQKKT